jgi:hypothetical protein
LAGINPGRTGDLGGDCAGSIAAATIRSFSARDQRRRRSTDVITSTTFVIGLALVIVLGLDPKTHLRKAAFTGRVQIQHLGLEGGGLSNGSTAV